MARAATPPEQAGLPGTPIVETGSGRDGCTLSPGVLRDRAGKPILFIDRMDALHVARLSREFLGREVRRVSFISRKGARLSQYGLALDTDAPGNALPTPAEQAAIEVFAWLRLRERGQRRKKAKLIGG